jgi:tagaturonate reductase
MKETILQFGAGNFLRAFVDVFVAQANRGPKPMGKIVVVQSTGRNRADLLNVAGGRYHVVTQGFANGRIVDEVEEVDSISRALFAGTDWDQVRAVACSPDLIWIVSNTTEAGFALDDADVARGGVPASFPAKLLDVLLARHESGQPGISIIPCELIEKNASRLHQLVLEQAARWQVPAETVGWLTNDNLWLNNLVDRIVPGKLANHPLAQSDLLLLGSEPFAFWAIETDRPFALEHPAVVITPDITAYYLRKVRILNGAHTALAERAIPLGLKTARECVEHPEIGPWLQDLLFDEIVPVLAGRVENPSGFARATLDRFRNPFLDHPLSAIALHHDTKIRVRLDPSRKDYRRLFGCDPAILTSLLA